ncbi:MAG: hypothetical protein LBI56_01685 [Puniceicoccales bacterium]|jgi:hypothetical protein|nr:hypothetical protein [Puniceicoccales bacterium]
MSFKKFSDDGGVALRTSKKDVADKMFSYDVRNVIFDANLGCAAYEDPMEGGFMIIREDSDSYCNWLEILSGD